MGRQIINQVTVDSRQFSVTIVARQATSPECADLHIRMAVSKLAKANLCQSTQDQSPPNTLPQDVSMNTKTGDGDEVEELGLFMVSDRGGVQPIWIDVEIEGKTVSMELDTGAAVSIMSSTA